MAMTGTPPYPPSFSDQGRPGVSPNLGREGRDNSDPDDLVATNLHCRSPLASPCDPRNFWISGYSERHILVEGWAYTGMTLQQVTPFWDPLLLAANDAAFTDPSEATIAKLRDEYGVRWLFADLTTADPDAIGRYADLRYRDGDFAVYELRRP